MATVTLFQPTSTQVFSFTPTLDGQQYSLIVTWNLAGARWYINLYTLDGVLILCRALIASPADDPAGIDLVEGYFATSRLVFREDTKNFEVAP